MCYYVKYQLYPGAEVKGVAVAARNKESAYDSAVYDIILKAEGELPYCAWVHSVTYNNGNHRVFNTFPGNPF